MASAGGPLKAAARRFRLLAGEGQGPAVLEGQRQVAAAHCVGRCGRQPGQVLAAHRALRTGHERGRTGGDGDAVVRGRGVGGADAVAVGLDVGVAAVLERDRVVRLLVGRHDALERGRLLRDRGQLPRLAGQPAAAPRAGSDDDCHGDQRDGDQDRPETAIQGCVHVSPMWIEARRRHLVTNTVAFD